MTDTYSVHGDFAPADSVSNISGSSEPTEFHVLPNADVSAAPGNTPNSSAESTPAEDVAPALPNGFVRLGLAQELIRAVEDLGYTQPTTVQDKVIPLAMAVGAEGEKAASFVDLMVSSQTGSGKTAAFLLPLLHTLLKQQADAETEERTEFENACAEAVARGEAPPKRAKRKDPTSNRNFKAATPGALILCPTRELAQQVAHDAIGLVQHCRGLRVANVVGGMPYQLQIAKLQNANLVVATPGRLLDLQRSMQIKLDKVQFLVVDEADRMLDLGFSDDLAEINQLTIERRQTMMFSATFAARIQQLAARVMRAPQRVNIDSPQEKHANIKQVLFWADNAQHKRKLLDHWLRDTTINQAIVFASTQVECDGLANDLQQTGFSAVALHGALSQGLRNRRLMALRQGQVQILVATDVAARGIDVPTITHVFNFGLPMKAEDYTHRIGRTGRAGRDGIAVTFAEVRDRRKIFDIESYSHQQFKAEVVPGLEPQQRAPSSARPPGGDFGGGRGRESRDYGPRDRKFGGGGARPDRQGTSGGFGGGFGGNSSNAGSGFGARPARSASGAPAGSYQRNSGGGFGAPADRGDRGNFGGGERSFGGGGGGDRRPARPEGQSYARPSGSGDNGANFGARREERAPHGDFVARKPAFNKAGPGAAAKPFVPHDARKRLTKPVR